MKGSAKYLCISLIFLLLFTTAFAQQPIQTDGQDETQITEQQAPAITVQPSSAPELELEVIPEQPVGEDTSEPLEPGVESTNEQLTLKTQTISAGNGHSLLIGENGTVWAAGRGSHGQLGNGTRGTDSSVPVQVKDADGTGFLTGVSAVEAGFLFSLALKSDGTLWAWGNATGFMTNSGDSHSDLPVQVIADSSQPLTGIVEISAKGGHWLALKSDGTVWAWGRNEYGQLGNGTTDNCYYGAVQVKSSDGTPLTGVKTISAGAYHSMAVKEDGTVWCWGKNENSQLGNQQTANASSPVQATGLTDVVQVSAGEFHSMVLKEDGTVWTWGRNQYGQLGDNTRNSATTPVQVKGMEGTGYLAGITQIEAGDGYSAAVGSGGTIYTWGHNYAHQLGDGTQQSKNAPVHLMHPTGEDWLLGVTEVSCGNSVTLVRIGDAFYTWGTNTYGEFGNGTSGNIAASPIAAFEVPEGPAAGEASLTVTAGEEYTLAATATGITTHSSNFELTYDGLKLELADFALQRFEAVTEPGVYGNLTVLSVEPGRIVFYINTTIPDGLTWSGLLSKIKFIAVEDGTASITLKTRQGGA